MYKLCGVNSVALHIDLFSPQSDLDIYIYIYDIAYLGSKTKMT